MKSSRFFISRDPAVKDTALWRILGAGEPTRLPALDFLSKNSQVVVAGRTDVSALYETVRMGIRELLPPEADRELQNSLDRAERELKVSPEALIRSIGEDGFIALQFDPDTTFALPEPAGTIQVPVPSLLIGIALKDNSIPDLIKRLLTETGAPLVHITYQGAELTSLQLPGTLPIPMQPTFGVIKGQLLFGLTAETVKQAIECAMTGNGRMEQSAEFVTCFEGTTPGACNGLIYASPVFMKSAGELAAKGLAVMSDSGGREMPAIANLLSNGLSDLLPDNSEAQYVALMAETLCQSTVTISDAVPEFRA